MFNCWLLFFSKNSSIIFSLFFEKYLYLGYHSENSLVDLLLLQLWQLGTIFFKVYSPPLDKAIKCS